MASSWWWTSLALLREYRPAMPLEPSVRQNYWQSEKKCGWDFTWIYVCNTTMQSHGEWVAHLLLVVSTLLIAMLYISRGHNRFLLSSIIRIRQRWHRLRGSLRKRPMEGMSTNTWRKSYLGNQINPEGHQQHFEIPHSMRCEYEIRTVDRYSSWRYSLHLHRSSSELLLFSLAKCQ